MKEACLKVVAERDGRVDGSRMLGVPDAISRRTLSHVDGAMTNLVVGIAGDEFDLDEVRDLIDEP